VREAAITKAEGDKQAAILEAQGQSEAIQRLADAEKYRQVAVAEGEANATRAV
jgi:regulator of protease activity HflC (stomatin/prohibitin superfamily)